MKFQLSFLLTAIGLLSFAQVVQPVWKAGEGATFSGDAMEIRQDIRKNSTSRALLPTKQFAGRFLHISGEVSGEKILTGEKFDGGKLLLSYQLDGKKKYLGFPIPTGTFTWKKQSFETEIPAHADDISLTFGFQNSAGTLKIRNLKLEITGTPVGLESRMNMALTDDVAGDGKGGWSDQGPQNDGRSFQRYFYKKSFGGVPFRLIPQDKSVLTMKSELFQSGPESVSITLPEKTTAKSLYLLHTLCWGPAQKTKIGTIEIQYRDGKNQKIDISSTLDVGDWWNPGPLSNGIPIFFGTSGSGGSVAVYLSRFPLEEKDVHSITFRSENKKAIWIIAGATVSTKEIPLPEFKPYVIESGNEWSPIKRFPKNQRISGSALDVSGYLPKEKAGDSGRVIIRNGHFVFEKYPDKKIRFFTCATGNLFHSKNDIDVTMKELRKNGYNMIRTHFFDTKLMRNAKKDLDFDPADLDLFDYMVFSMKQHGIYLNFDCMTSWNGYSPGALWKIKDRNLKKNSIYFDPAVREHWRKGVETLLCRKNPYTGTRLIDDPVLAMAVGFNEQEYAFIREFDKNLVTPPWRDFLKKHYKNMESLKSAWGPKAAAYRTFDDIPCFTPAESLKESDAARFLKQTEMEMSDWYCTELRKMGYKGVFSNYNMSKNLHYSVVRSSLDFVTMNSYHAHPGADYRLQDQSSSITHSGRIFRDLISTRLAGKPFVITEHSHVFWNRYRYEQGFVTGAYSAFQDVDSLAVHAEPYSINDPGKIGRFHLWHDPINTASEFLTFFAFVREDVRPSESGVRISIDAENIYTSKKMGNGLSAAQTNLALMTGFSSECIEKGVHEKPLQSRELYLKQSGESKVISSTSGFSATIESEKIDGTEMVKLLKQQNILSISNRSNGKNLFESSTGELLMDTNRRYLAVNTPRMQGICGESGTTADLADFRILSMSSAGCLAAVSIDGLKNLRESRRIILVYSTNALNREMRFTTRDMTRLLSYGENDVLLKSGRFTVVLRNTNASRLRLYPLDLAGNRTKVIAAERQIKDEVQFSVDTAKNTAIFFEIVAE